MYRFFLYFYVKINIMTPKETAKFIYDCVVKEGFSTDYCYSPSFYKWSKEMAIGRAKQKYNGEELDEIVKEINTYKD